MRLIPGAVAPDFRLHDADGQPHDLSQFRGRRTVIYFYPAAMTPGCTTQACDFRDHLGELEDSGYAVVGISPDPPAKLAKFRDSESLTFPLLSDSEHRVMTAYGAWGEKTLYGKKVTGVIRSTIVVDERGIVTNAWYNVKATGHVAKLLRDLQISA
jgi:peroxiredoxin Q/BCP